MIEEVTFSVYVLGLTDEALALLSFLQEKKNKIPATADRDRARFFILNKCQFFEIVKCTKVFYPLQAGPMDEFILPAK